MASSAGPLGRKLPRRQQIAVIGLGRFGSAVAGELVRFGHEVLGIDRDLGVVQHLSDDLSHVVQADALDVETLDRLGLADFDAVIVAVTENLEASILATLEAKRMGVPRVIAKAKNQTHGEILLKVGADKVVYPERDTGMRLAHSWLSFDITDTLDIIEGYMVSRVEVKEQLANRTIAEVITSREGVSLLLLARGARVISYPSPEERLEQGDVLVLAGQLDEMESFFSGVGALGARG